MAFSQSELVSMLKAIPVSELNYEEWLTVGMAIHYEGSPCSVWEHWSEADNRFHDGECEKKWKSFGKGSGKPVTGATIMRMATDRGWKSDPMMKTYDWDDYIPDDGETSNNDELRFMNILPDCPNPFDPVSQVKEYLKALFSPDEKVAIVVSSYKDKDGKYKPTGCNCSRSCAALLKTLDKYPDDLSDTLGESDDDAGAWVCFNPVNGSGRKDEDVVAWRYALIESDTMPIADQWSWFRKHQLPVAIIVHSGGKSLHAIVHVDAEDAKQYRERVDTLFKYCTDHKFPVDTANKNAARLSRLPGVKRGEKWQYIVHGAMGAANWEEWEHSALNPLPIHVIDGHWERLAPLKPELIHDILRQKHKMILISGSKAGKSFSLIHLAICIAEGEPWLGHDCEQGRVLYINLEIDEASFEHRIEKVYKAMGLQASGQLDAVSLRGKEASVEWLAERIKPGTYTAIIIDPFYKLGVEDENAAGDVGKFCRQLDLMTEKTGAAVIYSHHHSKGVQSGKNAMDRGSGSGVFARDADALIDLLELSLPIEHEDEAKKKYGQWCVPYRMDFTLREFAKIDPVDCFYSYPLLYKDEDGWLVGARAADIERSMNQGRLQGALRSQYDRDGRAVRLKQLVKKDRESGKIRSLEEYGKLIGVSVRTIQRYRDDDPEIAADFYGFDMT